MIGWSLGQDSYSVLAQIDEPNLGQRALARTPRLDLFGRKDSDESGERRWVRQEKACRAFESRWPRAKTEWPLSKTLSPTRAGT